MKNAVIGSTTTFARMYDVLTQAISSLRRAEIARHLRQRDVDDRGVEHLHDGGRDQAEEDEPAIRNGFVGIDVRRNWSCLCRHVSRVDEGVRGERPETGAKFLTGQYSRKLISPNLRPTAGRVHPRAVVVCHPLVHSCRGRG